MAYHTLGHKTSQANFRFQIVTFALRNHFIKVILRPSGSLLYGMTPVLTYFSKHTLRPPDLRGRTIWKMMAGMTGSCYRTIKDGAMVHPHKCQLGCS